MNQMICADLCMLSCQLEFENIRMIKTEDAEIKEKSGQFPHDFVESLVLKNFRNFQQLNLKFDSRAVIITGKNGQGKTNILEAISFLAPGKGLRSADLKEILCQNLAAEEMQMWKIEAILAREFDKNSITVKCLLNQQNSEKNASKEVLLSGKKLKTISSLASHVSVNWLTPQMDHLFIGPSAARRRFFDRMVLSFNPNHAANLMLHENQMQERMKILKNALKNGEKLNDTWLSLLEDQMAEAAVEIVKWRMQALQMINEEILQLTSAFPKAKLQINGESEEIAAENGLEFFKNHYRMRLKEMRILDQKIGKTNFGVHRSDLQVFHMSKNMDAARCSTGEQKALLISVILAKLKAGIAFAMKHFSQNSALPVILLDEVVAHLDNVRREELFQELIDLKIQAWITGTDEKIFESLGKHAQFIAI